MNKKKDFMVWRKKKNISENIEPTQNGKNSLIVLKDLDKVYHTDAGDFPALLNVDLEIGSGEFVSVIGKSGSGKTTLINMLTGIDQPSSGEIFVGGVAIHNLNEGEMAAWRGRNMGVVFQFFQLLQDLMNKPLY